MNILKVIPLTLSLLFTQNLFAYTCDGEINLNEGIIIYTDGNFNFEDQVTILDLSDDLEMLLDYTVDAKFNILVDGKIQRLIRLKNDMDSTGNYIFVSPIYDNDGNLVRLSNVKGKTITGYELSEYELHCKS
jgi:hypothetical protein